MAVGQQCRAARGASSPNPLHARALTLNLIPPDSFQCTPDRARSLSKCHPSMQLLLRSPPQKERKWEVPYSSFVAIFVGMSTTRMSVLYLHVLCQWIFWLISTPHTRSKMIFNTRGPGRACPTDSYYWWQWASASFGGEEKQDASLHGFNGLFL